MLLPLLIALVSLAGDEAPQPGFAAGSYGRVQMSSDLAGGGGDAVRVTRYAPRLELDPYMELDLSWIVPTEDETSFTAVITPAISGDVFHYDGAWGDQISIRNFYAQGDHIAGLPLALWAGSRMYRGDDVYLLDFWPLDNLNTYGGGAIVTPGDAEIALHVGANRLLGDDYQFQEALVAAPDSVSGERVLLLDRQRAITSLKLAYHLTFGKVTLRAKLYGELHRLPAGERLLDEPFAELEIEQLPDDRGSLVGLQLSAWGWAPQSFVHLWLRRSTGLAAYGELAIPSDGLALDLRAQTARDWMAALAGNTETDLIGVQWGSTLSYFVDADGQVLDFDDRWEWVGVVRPQVYLGPYVALGLEASHQMVRPNGVNPRSNELDVPRITKLSFLPAVQAGRGHFTRPRVQLLYTVSWLNEDARQSFSPMDARLADGVQHFVGIGAEWWVNSRRTVVVGE